MAQMKKLGDSELKGIGVKVLDRKTCLHEIAKHFYTGLSDPTPGTRITENASSRTGTICSVRETLYAVTVFWDGSAYNKAESVVNVGWSEATHTLAEPRGGRGQDESRRGLLRLRREDVPRGGGHCRAGAGAGNIE